jgi:hypothetical protein
MGGRGSISGGGKRFFPTSQHYHLVRVRPAWYSGFRRALSPGVKRPRLTVVELYLHPRIYPYGAGTGLFSLPIAIIS